MTECYLCGGPIEDTSLCGDCQRLSTALEVRMKQDIAAYFRAKMDK